MIIEFDTTTLSVFVAEAGSDAATIANLNTNKPASHSVQTIADDTDVLDNKFQLSIFIATVAGPTLISVIRKNVVTITPIPGTINLNDVSIIQVQLKQSDGVTNLAAVKTVTFSTSLGTLADATVTTDGSGFAQTAFKPAKGGSSVIGATSPGLIGAVVTVVINIPTTATAQGWIETDDIKLGAITDAKVAKITPPAWWFIPDMFTRAAFNASYDAASINSVVSDGEGFIYLNGLVAAVPTITKIDIRDGSNAGTLAYTNHNLADGYDYMAYDGENLWIPSNNDVLKVRTRDMSLQATVNIGTGKVESAVWDGSFIYVWLNTASVVSRLWKVTKAGTKTAIGSPINPFATAAQFATVTVDKDFIHVNGFTDGAAFLSRTTPGSYTSWAGGSTLGFSAATTGKELWISGTAGVSVIQIDGTMPNYGTIVATIPAATINQVTFLYFDGSKIWATRTTSSGSGTGRYVSKLSRTGSTINIDQTVDLTATVEPYPIASDGTNLYVGAFGTTADDVTKIFIGR